MYSLLFGRKRSSPFPGAILQNLHRFCRLPQKVKQQLFHFVSFTEQFCMKFHNAPFGYTGYKVCIIFYVINFMRI
ncbi:hypothetical protein BpHYR1_030107 [Brachionus plicatilis]|uniref:Uncharacterized protein n=1 Tax=Brachionus plicatilis TaxID=10195 RepID=A0A3M7PV69_BRAPC|nr:hypothetical protein BpHYR1_030107 [Brachionus plicatilis]